MRRSFVVLPHDEGVSGCLDGGCEAELRILHPIINKSPSFRPQGGT